MRMRVVNNAFAAALLGGVASLVPFSGAMAQDGWYMGAELGATYVPDQDTTGTGISLSSEYEPGYGILGQVGYAFGPVRLEGELGWRENGIDAITPNGGSGDASILSYMANAYYDIGTGTKWTPYVGAGIGGANLEIGSGSYDVDKTELAYQGILGSHYALNESLALKADYRYFAVADASGKARSGPAVETEYDSHALMVGFTYRFGAEPAPAPAPQQVQAPAPRPAPAPPPKPVQPEPMLTNFLVFFDFDKATLTPDGQAILDEVAAMAKKGQSVRVDLVGHADRAGPEGYNMRLSLARANAVKAYLANKGLAQNAVAVRGKGETAPLVSTADGVREPQNRRVEIILQ